MPQPNLDAELKTRVSPEDKESLELLAEARRVKLSHVLRECIYEKIQREADTISKAKHAKERGQELPSAA